MEHDFYKFPELTNSQMAELYFESPHQQITQDFFAKVVKVTDGDTLRVNCEFRDFDFPIRFINIASPEKKEEGGLESKAWLEGKVLGKEIYVKINPNNRVDRWGRLLGNIIQNGMDVGEESIVMGQSVPFAQVHADRITDNIRLPKEFEAW